MFIICSKIWPGQTSGSKPEKGVSKFQLFSFGVFRWHHNRPEIVELPNISNPKNYQIYLTTKKAEILFSRSYKFKFIWITNSTNYMRVYFWTILLCENHKLSKFIIFGNIFRQNPASFLNSCDNFLAIGDERGYGENMKNYSLSQNSRSRPSAANLDRIGSFTKNDVITNFSHIKMCQFSRISSNLTKQVKFHQIMLVTSGNR